MNFALGLKNMLTDAIRTHIRNDPHWRPPKRIELSHEVFRALRREMSTEDVIYGRLYYNDFRQLTFFGVEIREISAHVPPRMVTADNIIQEL